MLDFRHPIARFIGRAKVSISNTFAYFSIGTKASITNAKISINFAMLEVRVVANFSTPDEPSLCSIG